MSLQANEECQHHGEGQCTCKDVGELVSATETVADTLTYWLETPGRRKVLAEAMEQYLEERVATILKENGLKLETHKNRHSIKGQCQFAQFSDDQTRCEKDATRKFGDFWFCEEHGSRN
jgi:hypothetical protein